MACNLLPRLLNGSAPLHALHKLRHCLQRACSLASLQVPAEVTFLQVLDAMEVTTTAEK